MKTFTTRVRARYCETDAAEVIYYGSFMKYFEVGKMEMYRELGLPYHRDYPIVDTYCTYFPQGWDPTSRESGKPTRPPSFSSGGIRPSIWNAFIGNA